MSNPLQFFYDRFTHPVPTAKTGDWLPGHSSEVLATYDSACSGLAATAAAHDIEPDPAALAGLLATVTAVARQTVARAFDASKREMDRLRAKRGGNIELDLGNVRAEMATAKQEKRAAEDALALVDQPGSLWLAFAGQWAGAAVVSAITGVALSATLDVAGLHFTAVDVPAYVFIPYGVGGVFGLAVGLGFMEWASRLESAREIAKGAIWFATPMVLLGLMRAGRAGMDSSDAVATELFSAGVLTTVELTCVLFLAKLADARRMAKAGQLAARAAFNPKVRALANAEKRLTVADGEVEACERVFQAYEQEAAARDREVEKEQSLVESWCAQAELAYLTAIKQNHAHSFGVGDAPGRPVATVSVVRPTDN